MGSLRPSSMCTYMTGFLRQPPMPFSDRGFDRKNLNKVEHNCMNLGNIYLGIKHLTIQPCLRVFISYRLIYLFVKFIRTPYKA